MRVTCHPVAVQTDVSSFYNHTNFSAVTKPQSTFLRLTHHDDDMMLSFVGKSPQPSIRSDETEGVKEMKVVSAELFFFSPFLPCFSLFFVVCSTTECRGQSQGFVKVFLAVLQAGGLKLQLL